MLFVNTIEFNGDKAVINSYSNHPALTDGMKAQREEWAARFPNATVQTETLSTEETIRLVAEGEAKRPAGYCGHYSHCWTVGEASNDPN